MTRRELIAGAAALLAARPALAHREHRSETWAEWKPSKGSDMSGGGEFHVTHSFHRHDAELAMSDAGLLDQPDLSSLRARALLALHVEETFGLGEAVALETLGAEIVRDRVEVYQIGTADALPPSLDIDARMLRTAWPDQVNDVNVRVGDEVKSLRFRRDDGTKAMELV